MNKAFIMRVMWGSLSLVTLYCGLGFTGLVSGLSNTDSPFSKVLGAMFIVSGLLGIWKFGRYVMEFRKK